MKILKWVGIVIAVLGLILTIGPAMISENYSVVRTIETEAKSDVVFNQIVMLKNWDNWDPWSLQEPSAGLPIQGIDGTVGATRSWKGDTIGAGSMEITKIEPNSAIDYKLKFTEPMVSESEIHFKLEPAGAKTKISWIMAGKADGWYGRWFGLMMDGMIGKDFEKGLAKLDVVSKTAVVPASETMADPMAGDSATMQPTQTGSSPH